MDSGLHVHMHVYTYGMEDPLRIGKYPRAAPTDAPCRHYPINAEM